MVHEMNVIVKGKRFQGIKKSSASMTARKIIFFKSLLHVPTSWSNMPPEINHISIKRRWRTPYANKYIKPLFSSQIILPCTLKSLVLGTFGGIFLYFIDLYAWFCTDIVTRNDFANNRQISEKRIPLTQHKKHGGSKDRRKLSHSDCLWSPNSKNKRKHWRAP